MTNTAVKNAAEHTASLQDGREVYLDGAAVADVTAHPAFRTGKPRFLAPTLFSVSVHPTGR